MSSKLTNIDKQLLNAGNEIRIGNKPYENGIFGSNPNRDTIELTIFNTSGGVIDSITKSFSDIQFDNDDKLLLRPVADLTLAGLESGTYDLQYRFLRKLAGSEDDVLVRTVPNDQGKFDIFENVQSIDITDDGEIFEKIGGDRGQELQLKKMTLLVDAVSPSRTEIRIKASDINGRGNFEDFSRLGESVRRTDVPTGIVQFGTGGDENFITNTNVMTLTPEDSGFIFTPRMVGGTLYVKDVYHTSTITTTPTTENNIVTDQEELRKDDYGEVIKYGESLPWDSNLHANAVRPVGDWNPGYLHWYANSDTWGNSVHLGYWAHWVQGEGRDGGVCFKFPDINQSFAEDFTAWPLENPHRGLMLSHTFKDKSLEVLGVTGEDSILISGYIKSNVNNKQIRITTKFPQDLLSEAEPDGPPEGFFVEGSPLLEEKPSSPPDNYNPLTIEAAQSIENVPAMAVMENGFAPGMNITSFLNARTEYGWGVGQVPDVATGDDSTNLNRITGGPPPRPATYGTGVWKLHIETEQSEAIISLELNHSWGESNGYNNSQGTLSEGGDWEWDGEQWTGYPIATEVEPIVGHDSNGGVYRTVSPEQFPTAVNAHPYRQSEELVQTRRPLFERSLPSSTGFEYGCTIGMAFYAWLMTGNWGVSDAIINRGDIGVRYVMLGKQDLIWITKVNQSSSNRVLLRTWDEVFPQLRTSYVERDIDGETKQVSIYEDIFEFGFVQSITPAQHKDRNVTVMGSFHIFYNDGFGNNKSFRIDTFRSSPNKISRTLSDNAIYPNVGSNEVYNIRDLDEPFDNAINANDSKVKWTVNRDGGDFRFYAFVGNQYYRVDDGDGYLYEINESDSNWFKSDYPRTINEDGFEDFIQNPDVVFERDLTPNESDWTTWGIIKGSQYYKQEDDKHVLISTFDEAFIGAGTVQSRGEELVVGTRNPGKDNWLLDDEGNTLPNVPYIDNGSGNLIIGMTSDRIGTVSDEEQWVWTGPDDASSVHYWKYSGPMPPQYSFVRPTSGDYAKFIENVTANEWEKFEVAVPVHPSWRLGVPGWQVVFEGNIGSKPGIIWMDDIDVRFRLDSQSVDQLVKKPFVAQISSVNETGTLVELDKTFEDGAIEVSDDDDPANAYYQDGAQAGSYTGFEVTYTIFNPRELRTYLKFGNNHYLTTNFRQDRASVIKWPHSINFKTYEPLPPSIQKFSEVTVVKEMIEPLSETVRIVNFTDSPLGDRLLKSPDLSNVDSPLQRRTTQFKNESEILTSDSIISSELKNKIVSASTDSAEINVDYSRYENFNNFGSVERRIGNFKYKLELIESYNASSASLVSVSGSSDNRNLWLQRTNELKNDFDGFENYMYHNSSSYVSSSLGQFYDNAWPKVSGTGTLTSPYVLAHTTSSQATAWFEKNVVSASVFDEENGNKLSGLLPQHIIDDNSNTDYLKFTDMIAHHFDNIWIYIKGLSDTFDRRDKLDEGLSKDLLYSVGKSLGWNLNDSSDTVELSRFHSGHEVSGSSLSVYSEVSQKDITREIWGRIINNMPFFLKNKGTVKALKGLINVYGIPSTILRVKEYGGPAISDDEAPQFEITRKFTKALDFRSSQFIKVAWANDTDSERKPDTIEFRFRAVSSSNQVLIEKIGSDFTSSFNISLKDNNSVDNYGYVAFTLSGSDGQKQVQSGELPIYDGDFYSVMLRRTSGSDSAEVTQSFQLSVGKYDSSRSKIHLFSAATMSTDIADSGSYNLAYANDGTIFIGGSSNTTRGAASQTGSFGGQLSGSMMEYRHWTETLGVKQFKNHVANPQAYNGNTISSSYDNLVLRYSMNDNKDLSSDTGGIRDVSSNQTATLSGSHSGFTGNFFSNVVDELQSHIPSIGALRRTTKKIRIESNNIKDGQILQRTKRVTDSQYDTAANDSNKLGIFFAPTDVINNDIIQSVGDLNFENYLGDPRDRLENSYRGLKGVADNYWQKYTEPNNFWDYIRVLKYYDSSLFPQLRKLIPARAKADIGILIEPNIFERSKVVTAKEPVVTQENIRGTIDVTTDFIAITSSYNAGVSVSTFDAYSDTISISRTTESGSIITATGSYDTYNGTIDELKERNFDISIFQKLGNVGLYSNVTMSLESDTLNGVVEVHQPVISGSRIYGRNQKQMKFYTTEASHSLNLFNSSSFYNVDLDNLAEHSQAKLNSFYSGVKNTSKTTIDGGRPVEITITSPTKLVTQESGESTLKTGDGKVSNFKFKDKKKKKKIRKVSKAGFKASGMPDIKDIENQRKIISKSKNKFIEVKGETSKNISKKKDVETKRDEENEK